ncbi:MAG: sulfurtransferase TusA family protein [Deltaproteobacteria bacterium]|nr:sulfurtransferase TusA family protein [Deltaproteobacteria bacterium]
MPRHFLSSPHHIPGSFFGKKEIWRLRDSMTTTLHETYPLHWHFDDEFDGGEETCGRVIINLYTYLKPVRPGSMILIISRDPAARIEFPAWCRMTKNTLVEVAHPYYLVEYKPGLKKE